MNVTHVIQRRTQTLHDTHRLPDKQTQCTAYRASHVDNSIIGTQHSRRLCWKRKRTSDVWTELDGNPDSHDEIDQWECIQWDRPIVHNTEHACENHCDRPNDDHRRPDVKAEKDYRNEQDCRQTDAKVEHRVSNDGEILLVEYVENAAASHHGQYIRETDVKP